MSGMTVEMTYLEMSMSFDGIRQSMILGQYRSDRKDERLDTTIKAPNIRYDCQNGRNQVEVYEFCDGR